jgi:FHA domain
VIESSADGITVRDSGSANGIFVNGRKSERSRIHEGDAIKLGDVVVTLLPDPAAGTVVMADLDSLGLRAAPGPEPDAERTIPEVPSSELPAPAIRPPVSPPAALSAPVGGVPVEVAARPSPGTTPARPLTVTLLAALWALSVPLYVVADLALAWPMRGAGRAATAIAGLALALVAAVMAVGLWQGRRWSHHVQIAVAALGLVLCPFTLASIAVLVYMLRPSVRWHFSGRAGPEPVGAQSEPLFAGALLAAVLLGVLLTGGLTLLARTGWTGSRAFRRTPGEESVALDQLKAVAAAEDAFHSVCNTGYGDLLALREPASVIADYPADGPAFLRGPSFDDAEREGYRYALTVSQEMPAASGCPTRRFRHFVYSATPLGPGRSLAVSSDGVVRAAEGRAATPDDAPAE